MMQLKGRRRYHVETVSAGVVINAEAVIGTSTEAYSLMSKRQAEIADANQRLMDRYADRCKSSVLELDDSDELPVLTQFDYVYRVEECRLPVDQCVACSEKVSLINV